MNNHNNTLQLRQEIIIRIIKAFLSEDFKAATRKIPFDMRPKDFKVPYRCCIHKERAILRARTIAGLGGSLREDDEVKSLSEYANDALERTVLPRKALTIVGTACHGCVPSRIYITDLCQGCVARPCVGSCAFGAITIKNGRSVIDGEKCKNCTKCVQVCPYNAIAKIRVPCEEACPVDAIQKSDKGFAEIDFKKCISCGACITKCPFGAVQEKSHIIDILKAIKSGKEVVAMLAPSVAGQMPISINKIASGLIETGFSKVYEVAQGADLTAIHEAKDFQERIEKGDKFMTTSCCAAYNELVSKHLHDIKPYVSDTPTPAYFNAQIAKEANPDCISVFIGPCVAKRHEGICNKNIDFVMNFEEMGALFAAFNIELTKCPDYEFETKSSTQGRNFGITGGVAESVKAVDNNKNTIKPVCINGLDKQSIKELKKYAKNGSCAEGNLVEIMACKGGCIGGSATLNNIKVSAKNIKSYSEKGESINKDKL